MLVVGNFFFFFELCHLIVMRPLFSFLSYTRGPLPHAMHVHLLCSTFIMYFVYVCTPLPHTLPHSHAIYNLCSSLCLSDFIFFFLVLKIYKSNSNL